jgi:hypothetical protein
VLDGEKCFPSIAQLPIRDVFCLGDGGAQLAASFCDGQCRAAKCQQASPAPAAAPLFQRKAAHNSRIPGGFADGSGPLPVLDHSLPGYDIAVAVGGGGTAHSSDGEDIVGGPPEGESIDQVGAVRRHDQRFDFPGVERKVDHVAEGIVKVEVCIGLLEIRHDHGYSLARKQFHPEEVVDIATEP